MSYQSRLADFYELLFIASSGESKFQSRHPAAPTGNQPETTGNIATASWQKRTGNLRDFRELRRFPDSRPEL